RQLYAHPERMPPPAVPDPTIQAKQEALVRRLAGPDRDPELETQLRNLAAPTLVLFGTYDRLIAPEMGHFYKELIPNCHLVFVYAECPAFRSRIRIFNLTIQINCGIKEHAERSGLMRPPYRV